MLRSLTALICAAAFIALTGCGESEQEQAREAVQGYVDAQNDDDFEAVCDLYSDAFKAQLGITAEACPAFVEEQSSGAATSFELVGVNVNDDVGDGRHRRDQRGRRGPEPPDRPPRPRGRRVGHHRAAVKPRA